MFSAAQTKLICLKLRYTFKIYGYFTNSQRFCPFLKCPCHLDLPALFWGGSMRGEGVVEATCNCITNPYQSF